MPASKTDAANPASWEVARQGNGQSPSNGTRAFAERFGPKFARCYAHRYLHIWIRVCHVSGAHERRTWRRASAPLNFSKGTATVVCPASSALLYSALAAGKLSCCTHAVNTSSLDVRHSSLNPSVPGGGVSLCRARDSIALAGVLGVAPRIPYRSSSTSTPPCDFSHIRQPGPVNGASADATATRRAHPRRAAGTRERGTTPRLEEIVREGSLRAWAPLISARGARTPQRAAAAMPASVCDGAFTRNCELRIWNGTFCPSCPRALFQRAPLPPPSPSPSTPCSYSPFLSGGVGAMRGQGTAFRTAFREQRGRKRASFVGAVRAPASPAAPPRRRVQRTCTHHAFPGDPQNCLRRDASFYQSRRLLRILHLLNGFGQLPVRRLALPTAHSCLQTVRERS